MMPLRRWKSHKEALVWLAPTALAAFRACDARNEETPILRRSMVPFAVPLKSGYTYQTLCCFALRRGGHRARVQRAARSNPRNVREQSARRAYQTAIDVAVSRRLPRSLDSEQFSRRFDRRDSTTEVILVVQVLDSIVAHLRTQFHVPPVRYFRKQVRRSARRRRRRRSSWYECHAQRVVAAAHARAAEAVVARLRRQVYGGQLRGPLSGNERRRHEEEG